MTPPRRAATVLALLLTTGCTVTASDEFQPRGPLVAQDVVRLDLRDPLTREEAGFTEQGTAAFYGRAGEAIDVEVVLPGDRVLRTQAFEVIVAGPLADDRPEQGTDIRLNRSLPDLATVRSELLDEAGALGLDAAAVEQWADAVREPPGFGDGRVFTGSSATLPETGVETRYTERDGTWVLNYKFRFPE